MEKPTSAPRPASVRLRLLVAVLLAVLLATGYLFWRQWADEHQQVGPVASAAPDVPLDPELAARPGVVEFRNLGGRFEIDDSDSTKPITKLYLTSTKTTDAELALL